MCFLFLHCKLTVQLFSRQFVSVLPRSQVLTQTQPRIILLCKSKLNKRTWFNRIRTWYSSIKMIFKRVTFWMYWSLSKNSTSIGSDPSWIRWTGLASREPPLDLGVNFSPWVFSRRWWLALFLGNVASGLMDWPMETYSANS